MQTPLVPSTSTPERSDDEIEIDLRKYVLIVGARWRLLLTCTVIATLLGGLIGLILPSPYEATATVAIVKTSTQLEFDPRFKTLTQDEIANISADSRRATLLGLVENGNIASRVIARMESQLNDEERNPAQLLDKVTAATSGRGDLIMIKVRDQNPEKAANIASTWAREYERYVNELFAGAPSEYGESIANQYQRALDDFTQTQGALEQFIANSQIDQLARTITETRQLLDALQLGKQTALTLVISEQLKVNSEIIAAYLGAQSANRLIAFEKEQEGRRELIRAYLDAQNNAQVRVFSEQVRADLRALQDLYAAQVRVRRLIGDAKAMRDQVKAGGDAAAQSNSLALSLLKSQAFGLTVPISANLQIQIDGQTAPATAVEQTADLDALIAALEQRDAALTKEIDALSNRLLTGAGYRLDTAQVEQSQIAEAISKTYALLFDVGVIGRLSESVPVTNPLTAAAQERAGEILRFRSEALSIGSLIENGGDEVIQQLQQRLQTAQAQLEKEQATFDQLRRERDLKRDTVETLARKQAEVALATAVTGSEVRLASPAIPPERRTMGLLPKVAIAALSGFITGLIAAFIIHAFFEDAVARIPDRGAFNRAARWVLLPQPM
ncbi:MAG: Wzz/FepE/Etk N-terminal domain-containing protein [Candidatus Brachytrichaceae bacterium NZ_4S206]|jgi:capsular polysaccharide biosynthesis protein